jgi:hypothetical protein
MFLTDKLSQEGLTDSDSLLAERFEYVKLLGYLVETKFKLGYLFLND